MNDLVEQLERWYAAGAVWQVVDRRPGAVTVALMRCDGGEEIDRITSADSHWMAYLRVRDRSPE